MNTVSPRTYSGIFPKGLVTNVLYRILLDRSDSVSWVPLFFRNDKATATVDEDSLAIVVLRVLTDF